MSTRDRVVCRLRRWAVAFPVIEPQAAAWMPAATADPPPLTVEQHVEAISTHKAVEMLSEVLRQTLARTYLHGLPTHVQAASAGVRVETIDRQLEQAHLAVDLAVRGLVRWRPRAGVWDRLDDQAGCRCSASGCGSEACRERADVREAGCEPTPTCRGAAC